MNYKILLFFLSTLSLQMVFSKPILKTSSYLIGCFQTDSIGAMGLGGLGSDKINYPIAFYANRDGDNALATDYWYIKEEVSGLYSFRNAETHKYIRYDFQSTSQRTALVLVDTLLADKSTLFSLNLVQKANLCYYVIRSAANNVLGWNKRASASGGYYPVGGYAVTGADNECFVFYTPSGETIADDGKLPVSMPVATQNLGAFKSYFSSLTFSYKVPIINSSKKELFISIPENLMNTDVSRTVNFTLLNSSYKVYINNVLVTNGTDIIFSDVKALKTYPIEVKNGTSTVIAGTINFSSLPLLQVYTDASVSYVYSLGRIVLTEPESIISSDIDLTEIKIRGATSSGFLKKSYALKLKNPIDGVTPVYKSYLGLRSDNNWILDAMYIDPARMRNRVSTDLWNDFSIPPYFKAEEPNMINGTRGKFVEVFLNDAYNGIYCMTEKIDRKQLNLKKFKVDSITQQVTQRGALYKASQWSVATLLGNPYYGSSTGTATIPAYDNASETWAQWEVKYPDLGDGEAISWKPLVDAIIISSNYTLNVNFASKVANFYDIPVFVDYYLFLDLLLATDNHGKNVYLSNYDQTVSPKMTLTPWDLDGTWGRRWDASSDLTYANQSLVSFINANEHMENNLYIRLKKLNLDNFNEKLIQRYRELRNTYFTHQSIMSRFETYLSKFKLSGADQRERAKWPTEQLLGKSITFDDEMTFLSNWVSARLSFLDNQYLLDPNLGANMPVSEDIGIFPAVTSENITVTNLRVGTEILVTSLQGLSMMKVKSEGNNTLINLGSIPAGVYLVKAADKTVKIIKK